MLADLQARRELPDAKMERDAPACILSVLSLVTERIGQLRRVVRNEENPGNLWAPHNAVEDPETSGEYPGDIVLFSWGSHRLPLVMWGDRGKAREVAPEASEVSQGEGSRKPAPSAPASNDPKKQNG